MTIQDHATDRPKIAVGPALPGFGSWEWVGEALLKMLASRFDAVPFTDSIPDCDVLVIVKHLPPAELVARVARRSAVLYCPIDYYGSARDIDADALTLRRCARVLVHCHRLRKYFQSYSTVECVDHQVRFVTQRPVPFRSDGCILWTGVRSNIPFLAERVNQIRLPGELRLLTNLEGAADTANPVDFGFDVSRNAIQIARWNGERHVQATAEARCALDFKGNDFRQRHKPPTKAMDFIASGLPLAMNDDSSSVEYLAGLGFEVASPLDTSRWLSLEYHEATTQFGALVRERLSFAAVGRRYLQIIEAVLRERGIPGIATQSAGAA